jgi:hypothetical protein
MGGNTPLARQLRGLHQVQSLPPIVSLFNRSGQRQREARSLAGIGKRCRCRATLPNNPYADEAWRRAVYGSKVR